MSSLIAKLAFYRPRIAQLFGFVALLAGATMFYYENAFISYPQNPDVGSERTVAYVVKYDLIRYVTPTEAFIGHATHYVLFVAGGIFGLLVILEMKKRGVWFRSDH